MQNPLHELLEKEMDRHDFLVHIGAGFMALVGLSSVLKFLNGHQTNSTTRRAGGYSGGTYGR